MKKFIWPPEATFEYDAEDPTIENGIVIQALPGGKPKNKNSRAKDETR